MLNKIISGGQTGADQGGLEAGRELGLETGGTAPYNWMTADGPQKELLESFGLKAGPFDDYVWPMRTWFNASESDGTAIFGNVDSPGSRLTVKYCKELEKPLVLNPTPRLLATWLREKNISTLNVAGNREHRSPGIKETTKRIVIEAVRKLTSIKPNLS